VFPQVTGGFPVLAWRAGSRGVPLCPAVTRTHDGRNPSGFPAFWWASCGPRARAEGLLDVPAGDLVMAWYAVGVDGEQDIHAVPGAGGDLGRGSTGGQPQRQRRVPQVVRAQYRVDGVLG
jgi:hypothetical protein